MMMEKIGQNPTWSDVQCFLPPKEWRKFSDDQEINWSKVYKRKLSSGTKILPDAVGRPWDNESRLACCPFEVRDVPCAIDSDGNINLEDYIWVNVTGI